MLKDKIVLITGSSSGIGAATARLAKERGATVILHGRTEDEKLKALANELACDYIFCDVADKSAVDSEIQRIVKKVGRIDALVNSAGIAPRAKFMAADEDWLNIFKVNVLGTVHFCQSVLPIMQQQKSGKVVNISSLRGFTEAVGTPAYSSSKAAIINLTASLAKEYAPDVLVNSVAPGFTETPLSKNWDEALWQKAKTALIGRVLQPEEIAEPILFLISDKNTVITGQTILADGGYSIRESNNV